MRSADATAPKPKRPSPSAVRAQQRALTMLHVEARGAERQYGAALRHVAEHVGAIASEQLELASVPKMAAALRAYARLVSSWAKAAAGRMLADVDRRSRRGWTRHAQAMGLELRREINSAPTGVVMRESIARQVDLITSLPREAAERAQRLAVAAQSSGARADVLARELQRTGLVTKARANCIARTETSRAATELTQARAQFIGSPGYIWRTLGDSDVRDDHKRLEGTFHKWDEPPIADREAGVRAHPGCIYNCRCYPEVVMPENL